MVLPMSVNVLLAVGSDYNLPLVSRMKEEMAAGIKTDIIRAMAFSDLLLRGEHRDDAVTIELPRSSSRM
jgi:hypothetical protein